MAAIAQTVSHRAEAIAAAGRVPEAIHLLQRAAAIGSAGALHTLAMWRLSGDKIPRKLSESRELFRRAAALGDEDANRIYNAFLANGTGGPVAWSDAVKLLSARAQVDADAARQLAVISAMALDDTGDPSIGPQPEPLSTSPHVTLLPKLFSPDECAYLAEVAAPRMQPAVIVHPQSGRLVTNPVRTSESAGFPLTEENPAIHALNRRIAAASRTHVSQGEPLQVLRYRPGQEYKPHSDALVGEGNQRVVTMLVYLNNAYRGGETHFLANGLKVRGEPGDGLLFRNVGLDGRPDDRAAHAGLPVTSGVKLIASRWIRARPLQLEPA
jgi:prolyl 4-hydroxylase